MAALSGLVELDSDERQNTETPLPNREKISPKVAIPGRKEEIYKSTLVSVLNEDPHLSHDRYYIHFCSSWSSWSVEVALF